jgi:hypothetical protein
MKKAGLFALAALALAALLGGCGGMSAGEEDIKTMSAPDGSVMIDVPDSWTEDPTQEPEGFLVLSIGDGEGAFAQVFYYPDDGSGDTAQDLATMLAEDYYGDNVIGGLQEATIKDADAIYFEYSMTDEGADGNQYNYHGYEYVLGFGLNIVEVDIFYSQDTLQGKLFSPSKDQLAVLRGIAETVRISE